MSVLQSIRFAITASRLGATPYRSPSRVEHLQRRRLRRLLRYAVAHSPYYRTKFRGCELERADLASLPITRKEELAENFDCVVTNPRIQRENVERFLSTPKNLGRWFLGQYGVSRTSGSQGRPLLIVQDRRALELLFAIMSARASTQRPTPLEGLRRLRSPKRVAIVATQRGFYPSGAAFELMPELVGAFVRVERLAAQQPDLFQRLNAFQPHVLVGYASVLDALAWRSDQLQLTELRQIANSSEQLTPRSRQHIESTFGVPVIDHYATGECLFLSDGCPTHGGAHINSDWAIVEVVDNQYRPVAPGQLGDKVLITNLANRVQPFIRYEVDDRISLATQPCGCGSRLPRIERIEGRSGDLFWTRDANGDRMLSGVLLHTAADAIPDIREWQALQTERNRIEWRVQLAAHSALTSADVRSFLLAKLHELGLPREVVIDVRLVHALGHDPATGKRRRMISIVGPPNHVPAISGGVACQT
ncbi:MAG: phenylacetate--CoA ligase family protein [Singulisphaera sp.]